MKRGLRIYLDVCCLNRPFDDQSQERVRIEAEAVLTVLARVQRQECRLVSSEVVDTEIDQNPDLDRRRRVRDILRLASYHVPAGARQLARSRELAACGLSAHDAAHLACAEEAGVDVMLTTDDDLIRKVQRARAARIRVCNPVRWVAEGEI